MNRCGVYVICCEPTGSRYLGYSVQVVKRIREHFYRLERGVHRNPRLQSAYKKYGKDSFSTEVLLYCDPANLEQYGKQMIEKLRPEFNIVHIQNIKREWHRNFRAMLKEDDRLARLEQEIERKQKRFESMLKRTLRL
jgi:group I intron endonuclease